jgi:hypothetical protein
LGIGCRVVSEREQPPLDVTDRLASITTVIEPHGPIVAQAPGLQEPFRP